MKVFSLMILQVHWSFLISSVPVITKPEHNGAAEGVTKDYSGRQFNVAENPNLQFSTNGLQTEQGTGKPPNTHLYPLLKTKQLLFPKAQQILQIVINRLCTDGRPSSRHATGKYLDLYFSSYCLHFEVTWEEREFQLRV